MQPDLALIDIPIGGLETARAICQRSPATRVVFLTGAVIGPHQATSGLAHAYVYRNIPSAAIATLLRALPADHDDAGSPPRDERPPPLDLPLCDPFPLSQSPPERFAPATPAPALDRKPPAIGSAAARLRRFPLPLVQTAIVAAVGLALLIAALLGAGGAALALTGFALATLAAAASLSPDPLARRALPALAATLFAIVALSWAATGGRSIAADGLIPALIVLAELGVLCYRGERSFRSPSPPPTTPAAEFSEIGAPTP